MTTRRLHAGTYISRAACRARARRGTCESCGKGPYWNGDPANKLVQIRYTAGFNQVEYVLSHAKNCAPTLEDGPLA